MTFLTLKKFYQKWLAAAPRLLQTHLAGALCGLRTGVSRDSSSAKACSLVYSKCQDKVGEREGGRRSWKRPANCKSSLSLSSCDLTAALDSSTCCRRSWNSVTASYLSCHSPSNNWVFPFFLGLRVFPRQLACVPFDTGTRAQFLGLLSETGLWAGRWLSKNINVFFKNPGDFSRPCAPSFPWSLQML